MIMNAMILRVVKQGEPFSVQSQKSENGQMMKCNIVLQEMGGKYEIYRMAKDGCDLQLLAARQADQTSVED